MHTSLSIHFKFHDDNHNVNMYVCFFTTLNINLLLQTVVIDKTDLTWLYEIHKVLLKLGFGGLNHFVGKYADTLTHSPINNIMLMKILQP